MRARLVLGVLVCAAIAASSTPANPTVESVHAAPAAGQGTTTLDDQIDLSVTVYNSDIALVRDVRNLDLEGSAVGVEAQRTIRQLVFGQQRHLDEHGCLRQDPESEPRDELIDGDRRAVVVAEEPAAGPGAAEDAVERSRPWNVSRTRSRGSAATERLRFRNRSIDFLPGHEGSTSKRTRLE